MKNQKTISILVFFIALFSFIATIVGIFSQNGKGEYVYQSIHDQNVEIYGRGVYQYMSKEAAISAIAQDHITLLLGIPLLIISLYLSRKGLLKGKFLLAGTLLYFLTINLFHITTANFNQLFLIYAATLSASFFALILTLSSFNIEKISSNFSSKLPVKFVGGYLMFGAFGTVWSWLSLVVPPLIEGTVPVELQHYTTMVIQGFDLSIFLPISFLSGLLLIKKKPIGYLMAGVYINFLAILMISITAIFVGQKLAGIEGIDQQMFTFLLFSVITIICSFLVLKNIKEAK